jgi:phage-related tail fiber protein
MLNPIAPIATALAQEKNIDTTVSTTISNTTTSAPTSSPSGMELLQDLVYQEDEKLVSQIPINQTHAELTVEGNGTLTLPNLTETIRTTATKTGIVSMIDGTFAGKAILTTEDGSENATATVYEIVRFNMESGNGTGIAMTLFHTNSTGLLAPLDGMVLTGHGELYTDRTGVYSLWKWKIGIP